MAMIFLANVVLRGRIRCVSGLHIGGSDRAGPPSPADAAVVRDPVSGYPYIPGSSLKGRLRGLLTGLTGDADGGGLPARIFGASAGRGAGAVGPTRLAVRDAAPTEATRAVLDRLVRERGLPHVEVKVETALNRITGEASPRFLERVPAGAEFDLTLVYSLYDVDGDKVGDIKGLAEVVRGLRLLEDSTLGGGGSRGSGQVAVFLAAAPTVRDARSYLEARPAEPAVEVVPVGTLEPAAYANTVAAALGVSM
jgi:CRISPR-associated protein Csm3